jgi:hypothetical protein
MCRYESGKGTRHGLLSLTIVNVCGRGRSVVALSPWMWMGEACPPPSTRPPSVT